MLWIVLALIPVGLAISAPVVYLARGLGHRLGALDAAGVKGQVKAAARPIPNTGGIGIAMGLLAPLTIGLCAALVLGADASLPGALAPIAEHLPGLREAAPDGAIFVILVLTLHVLGLLDDRKPLGWKPKLFVMLAVCVAATMLIDRSRLLTMLDEPAGGAWLSIIITALWLLAITNAFNFLDNMDGLAGGVGLIAGAFLLVAALIAGQWFVAAALALLIGALAGFLLFNFPPASVFMGDSGSLVLGFTLAFLTVRTTYIADAAQPTWHALFVPVVVLAVPLYDLLSVCAVRLSQGKSPFVGDLQHFSHRLVKRGMSKRAAVLVIYAYTAVTAIGGVALPALEPWQAALVGAQTLLVLGALAAQEWASSPSRRALAEAEGREP